MHTIFYLHLHPKIFPIHHFLCEFLANQLHNIWMRDTRHQVWHGHLVEVHLLWTGPTSVLLCFLVLFHTGRWNWQRSATLAKKHSYVHGLSTWALKLSKLAAAVEESTWSNLGLFEGAASPRKHIEPVISDVSSVVLSEVGPVLGELSQCCSGGSWQLTGSVWGRQGWLVLGSLSERQCHF